MMNRRDLLKATALAAIVFSTKTVPTFAQEATATPDDPFGYAFDKCIVAAGRTFEVTSTQFETVVNLFESKEAAEAAFEQRDKYIESYLSTGAWREGTLKDPLSGYVYIGETVEPNKERQPMSAPKIGDKHDAVTASITLHDSDFVFTFFTTQKDATLYLFVHICYDALLVEDMFELAESTMSFKSVDATSDEQVLSLLPTVDDMPLTTVMTDEWITR
jgi:hypothetical protein